MFIKKLPASQEGRGRTDMDCSTDAIDIQAQRVCSNKKASRIAGSLYPEPGSNRHGLLHWCHFADKPSVSIKLKSFPHRRKLVP